MDRVAPVILFAYNRPEHLKITLDCLCRCELIEQTPLYVFCDGAKGNREDVESVGQVKMLLDSYPFNAKTVQVAHSEDNKGLARSVISGVNQVFEKHEKVIVIEDDISVSENFLIIMNELLEKYRDDGEVGSLSGYLYPMETSADDEDFFLLPRASSWGWATWNDRWQDVDWNIEDFETFISEKSLQAKFNQGGEDLTPMLWKWKFSLNDSWAVRWSYHHFKAGQYCLFPKSSIVINHGNDGSGTHSPRSNRFRNEMQSSSDLNLPSKVKLNPRLIEQLQKFFKPSALRRVINYFTFLYHYRIKRHS